MSAQLTDEEALNRVASYCSTAEHCRAEINEKLQRWGIAYDTIARILDRLESEKFIDDERFCRAFVNDKFRFAKWGKMKIAQGDRKSTRLNSSHNRESRMPSSA